MSETVIEYVQAGDEEDAWIECQAAAADHGPNAQVLDCFWEESLQRWVCKIKSP